MMDAAGNGLWVGHGLAGCVFPDCAPRVPVRCRGRRREWPAWVQARIRLCRPLRCGSDEHVGTLLDGSDSGAGNLAGEWDGRVGGEGGIRTDLELQRLAGLAGLPDWQAGWEPLPSRVGLGLLQLVSPFSRPPDPDKDGRGGGMAWKLGNGALGTAHWGPGRWCPLRQSRLLARAAERASDCPSPFPLIFLAGLLTRVAEQREKGKSGWGWARFELLPSSHLLIDRTCRGSVLVTASSPPCLLLLLLLLLLRPLLLPTVSTPSNLQYPTVWDRCAACSWPTRYVIGPPCATSSRPWALLSCVMCDCGFSRPAAFHACPAS